MNNYQGLNSRLDEIQAAILRTKLPRLNADNQRRREIAKFYCENITVSEITLPVTKDFFQFDIFNRSHVWHLFVIRHPFRDDLQKYLTKCGVQTLIHYPIPPHKQSAYKQWNDKNYPITEKIHREVLSLPISPLISDMELNKLVKVLNEYLQ